MTVMDIVMKDDGLGFGDKVGCCPICNTPFVVPIEILFNSNKPESYPCSNCGQMIRLF